jgi:hypothetical protein
MARRPALNPDNTCIVSSLSSKAPRRMGESALYLDATLIFWTEKYDGGIARFQSSDMFGNLVTNFEPIVYEYFYFAA